MPKRLPDTVVIRTSHFEIGQDKEVPIPGFFIIRTRKKLRSFADLSQEQAIELISLLCALRRGMSEVLGIEDAYIFQNDDSEHNFHVRVFPRHEWMERFGRGIESVLPIMRHAKKEMDNQKARKQIKDCVLKMREFLEDVQSG